MRWNQRAGLVGLFLTWFVVGLPAFSGEADVLAKSLREAGIEPDRAGLEKFLQAGRLTPGDEARIRALLANLGSDRFQVREKAMAELLRLPYLPGHLCKEAVAKDEETRRRVEQILSKGQNAVYSHRVLLVLRYIEASRVKGLTSLLLESMPQWPESYLTQAATKAIEACAERGDGDLLRRALKESRLPEVRAAALRGLAKALAKDAQKDLEAALNDAAPGVCLEAAIALLNQGKRTPLADLVRLLDAEQPDDRQAAISVLRAVSGQTFPYASYDEPKERARAVAVWRAWVKDEGSKAKLLLPIADHRLSRGRLLIGVYGEKALREIDMATGKTLFEAKGFDYVWGCHATFDGHRLAVDYQHRYVVEYDNNGKEIGRHNLPGRPTSVERLTNGRTLLALPEPGKLVELDRSGTVVWTLDVQGLPTGASRLPNGNTLVTLQDLRKVVEMDRDGKIVWEVVADRRPHTVQQLPNGNILVCFFEGEKPGGITEYNRAGKVVWSKDGIRNPAQAQRLPNGNTLISGDDGLMEYDPQGNVVKHLKVSRVRFFAY